MRRALDAGRAHESVESVVRDPDRVFLGVVGLRDVPKKFQITKQSIVNFYISKAPESTTGSKPASGLSDHVRDRDTQVR